METANKAIPYAIHRLVEADAPCRPSGPDEKRALYATEASAINSPANILRRRQSSSQAPYASWP